MAETLASEATASESDDEFDADALQAVCVEQRAGDLRTREAGMVVHRAVPAEDGSKELLDAERYDEGHQQHQLADRLRHRTRSRRLVVDTEIMQTG